ncbi:hypothetical protein MVEN_00502600 [Mycena venus]|uniref:Uncharacterized protein n=1 Tax=Mycena venus TaxID=2733690 RepID=A0A8H7CI17_9AGAR|nr:hypothetical protein MVEN_02144800 [Mycena venus]KAF7366251.1 hypothetical protein MVEN_00502600 [Mycena venus]
MAGTTWDHALRITARHRIDPTIATVVVDMASTSEAAAAMVDVVDTTRGPSSLPDRLDRGGRAGGPRFAGKKAHRPYRKNKQRDDIASNVADAGDLDHEVDGNDEPADVINPEDVPEEEEYEIEEEDNGFNVGRV